MMHGLTMPAMPTLLAQIHPLEHVVDRPVHGQWYASNVTIMLILAALITAGVLIPPARRIAAGQREGGVEGMRPKGLWVNMVEAICLGLRDHVFRPLLGDQTDKYIGFLWTLFWFILICNLLGVVPVLDVTGLAGLNHGHGIGGTPTQSIWVTGALALTAGLFWNLTGFIKDPLGFLYHLTGDAPWYVWPMIVPIELMGLLMKPFALAVRLFANMTGGHVLLAALFAFTGIFVSTLGAVGVAAGLGPIAAAAAVSLLEIVVACIQAFIFAFLTALFLAQLVVHEEHHQEEEHTVTGHLDEHEKPSEAPIPGAAA